MSIDTMKPSPTQVITTALQPQNIVKEGIRRIKDVAGKAFELLQSIDKKTAALFTSLIFGYTLGLIFFPVTTIAITVLVGGEFLDFLIHTVKNAENPAIESQEKTDPSE